MWRCCTEGDVSSVVGSNDPKHRIDQLEQLVGTLNRKLNEALRDLTNAQRLVKAYESTTSPENRPRSLEDDLDAALRVPDIFDAIFALTVRSESWAVLPPSATLGEADAMGCELHDKIMELWERENA